MSETPDIAIDSRHLAALAAKLGASPREVLALAARLATVKAEAPVDGARIDAELARVRAAAAGATVAIDILLLGYARYSSDDIDRALEIVWAGSDLGGS